MNQLDENGEVVEPNDTNRDDLQSPKPESKACPACSESILLTARKCRFCGEFLDHCAQCGSWIAKSLGCEDCGKTPQNGMPVGTLQKSTTSPAELQPKQPTLDSTPQPGSCDFRGSATGLIFLYVLRSLFFIATVVCAFALVLKLDVLNLIQRNLDHTSFELRARIDEIPADFFSGLLQQLGPLGVDLFDQLTDSPTIPLALVALVSFSLVIGVTTAIRHYRIRHTWVFERSLEHKEGCFARFFHRLGNLLLLVFTLGLAMPWIYARKHRFYYRSCVFSDDRRQHLEFSGSGGQVLGLMIISFLLAPLVIASLGILFWLIAWFWIDWEQSHISVPDRNGMLRSLRFICDLAVPFRRTLEYRFSLGFSRCSR